MDGNNSKNKTLPAIVVGAIVTVATTAIYALVSVFSIYTEGGDKSKEKSKECKCFTNKLWFRNQTFAYVKCIVNYIFTCTTF